MSGFAHDMPFGAQILADGAVRFRLWAPKQTAVSLLLNDEPRRPLQARGGGWFELVAKAAPGDTYRFALASGEVVPDPASRFQPQGVHGASLIVDPNAYAWRHGDWRGRPWHETVLYELHVGAFSAQGDYDGVLRALDRLAALGVTAIELMPLAQFPGARNWGYDGALPFAPAQVYGPPEALKALVDAAHARGLMMFLDVVYNHFGPEGNYLHLYAPAFFTERHATPWGAAIDFAQREVREFFIHNALYWLNEYRFDGLRLDAVHAIHDDGPEHIVMELARRAHAHAPDRHVHLVLENGDNIARFLERGAGGAPLYFDAQWNDDFHHACHVAATGETAGYYSDYKEGRLEKLGRALAQGFVYQGEVSPFHRHAPRGEPSAHLPATAFVNFLQNHDQIGNRALGERLSALATPDALRALTALLLLAPAVPMLFMGEEEAVETPFLFFCDFSGTLADAVREGRRQEFAAFPEFSDPALRARIPDPGAPETFLASILPPADDNHPRRAFIRHLLALRRAHIAPRLPALDHGGVAHVTPERLLEIAWTFKDGAVLTLVANPGATAAVPRPQTGTLLFATHEGYEAGDEFPPWYAAFYLVSP